MLADALDLLLDQDPAQRQAAERTQFDHLSAGRPLVLMGAGGLGRRTLAGLRAHGVQPLAFADNSPARQGTAIDGLPVLSPTEAAQRFARHAAFVVTIWGANSPHRFSHSREQLAGLGCDVICSFPSLFWKHAESLLPFYLQDLPSKVLRQRDAVRDAFQLWEDARSRAEYVDQVRFRLSADFDGLSGPVPHRQYFPDDLYDWQNEWVVDAGAFDGDTIRDIVRLYGSDFARIVAIEPDPLNFARLQLTRDALPVESRRKISCRHIAVGRASGTLMLNATGTAASASGEGTFEVTAHTLDEVVGDERPTLIKLDIEGAEIDALEGGRHTIVREKPVLAVCVYHLQDHLWNIPRLLRDWNEDYALFLRPHNEEGWDLVCYAVPRARLKGGRS